MRMLPWCVPLLLGMKCPGPPPEEGDAPPEETDAPPGETDEITTTTTTDPYSEYVAFMAMLSGYATDQYAPATDPTTTYISLGFYTYEGRAATCTRRTLGDCFDLACVLGAPGNQVLFGAGVIDVTGLAGPIPPLTETYPGVYPGFFDSVSPTYYVPGQDVTMTASGGDVPTFTITAPAPDQNLTVTDPPPPVGYAPETVPRDTDRLFAWDPTSLGRVTVRLDVLTGSPDEIRTFQCSRLGDPLVNEMLLPLSQVDLFNATSAFESISYTSDASIIVGDFEVTFELGSPVIGIDGQPYGSRTLLFE